jgi:hypothetical protein
MTNRAKERTDTKHFLHPEQIRIWKRMSPAEKLQLANSLYWSAWEAKGEWLRQIHPSWKVEQIEEKVRDIFLHAAT